MAIAVFYITLPVYAFSDRAMVGDAIVDYHSTNPLTGFERNTWAGTSRIAPYPSPSGFYQDTLRNPLQYAQVSNRIGSIHGRVLLKSNGKGLAAVAVRLLDPDGILMDTTKTDNKGFFTIDLNVLEDDELAQIKSFVIEVTNKQGIRSRIKIQDKGKRTSNILKLGDITVP